MPSGRAQVRGDESDSWRWLCYHCDQYFTRPDSVRRHLKTEGEPVPWDKDQVIRITYDPVYRRPDPSLDVQRPNGPVQQLPQATSLRASRLSLSANSATSVSDNTQVASLTASDPRSPQQQHIPPSGLQIETSSMLTHQPQVSPSSLQADNSATSRDHLMAAPQGPFAAGTPQEQPDGSLRFNDERDDWVEQYNAKHGAEMTELPTEDEELYCNCMKPVWKPSMWQCSNSKDCMGMYYHPKCLGLAEYAVQPAEGWLCSSCESDKERREELQRQFGPKAGPRPDQTIQQNGPPKGPKSTDWPGPFASNEPVYMTVSLTSNALIYMAVPLANNEPIDLTVPRARNEQMDTTAPLAKNGSLRSVLPRPKKPRPTSQPVLSIATDSRVAIPMSLASANNQQPWTADVDKQFINDVDNANDFNLNSLDDAKFALRSRPARDTSGDDGRLDSENSEPRTSLLIMQDTPTIPTTPTTPKKETWKLEEDQALIEVVKYCTEVLGLSGEPLWDTAILRLHAMGVPRSLGGAKMRWCRGLREQSQIDERRRKTDTLLTALQNKQRKGAEGIGRGKSTQYGKAARAQQEQEREEMKAARAAQAQREQERIRRLKDATRPVSAFYEGGEDDVLGAADYAAMERRDTEREDVSYADVEERDMEAAMTLMRMSQSQSPMATPSPVAMTSRKRSRAEMGEEEY